MANLTIPYSTYPFFNSTVVSDLNDSLVSTKPLPLWTIIRVSVCSTGLLANSLIIFVIMYGSLRKSVFMNLLMILASFDSLFLIATINIQTGIFGQMFVGPSTLHCSLNISLLSVAGLLSSWVTVLISIERFIAIYFPFKVHLYCTKMRTYITIIAMTFLVSLYSIPYFYISGVTSSDRGPICQIIVKSALILAFRCSTYIIYSILPFFIVAVLNIFIIRKIQVHKAFQQQQQSQTSSVRNKSLLVLMVLVCLVFVVTTFPGAIVMIFHLISCLNKSKHCLFFKSWLFHLVFMLEEINHSVNFFLYCLSGSVFRHALFQLFRCNNKQTSENNLHQLTTSIQNVV